MKKLKVLISTTIITASFFIFGYCQEVSAQADSADYPTKLELTMEYIDQNLSDSVETEYVTNPSSSYPYKAGTVSDKTLDYALNVINYIRNVAHLDSVELKAEYTEAAQHGVVLLDALGTVTHDVYYDSDKPALMLDAFFNSAKTGVSLSNLTYGQSTFRDSISVQMHDGDSFQNLLTLGHRRYILNPLMQSTGLGVYNNYYAVYNADKGNSSAEYDFVAWPAAGNQPTEFHVAQEPWSITLNPEYYNTSDLSDAQITVIKAETGQSVTLTKENYSSTPSIKSGYFNVDTSNYGVANCIAFHPGTDNIGTDNTGNYLVCISGLKTKSGEDTSIIYETSLFSAESYVSVTQYPTKEGYTFDGWYYDEEFKYPYDESDPETTDVDKDTLYIKWVANEYYVYYYANGGSGSTGGLILETATYDQPYTFLDSGFAHQNSRLAGWSTTADGEIEYELGETIDSWNRTSRLILYAVWEKADYTLTFVTNSSDELESVVYRAEALVDLSQYVPTKEGYEFKGWYLDSELTNPVTEFTIKSDTTVYAGWTANVIIVPTDPDASDTDPVSTEPALDKNSKTAYIDGYDDNTVRPEASITRGEVAIIFYNLLTEETREYYQTTQNSFSDVGEGDWYNEAISTLANANIIDGYSNGTFLPEEKITRAELVKITASFEELTESTGNPFTDITNHWAEKYIVYGASLGWIDGYSDGTFLPDQNITRGETIKIVNAVTNRSIDDYNLSDFIITWSDNSNTEAWYYWEVQIATNTHVYTIKA